MGKKVGGGDFIAEVGWKRQLRKCCILEDGDRGEGQGGRADSVGIKRFPKAPFFSLGPCLDPPSPESLQLTPSPLHPSGIHCFSLPNPEPALLLLKI